MLKHDAKSTGFHRWLENVLGPKSYDELASDRYFKAKVLLGSNTALFFLIIPTFYLQIKYAAFDTNLIFYAIACYSLVFLPFVVQKLLKIDLSRYLFWVASAQMIVGVFVIMAFFLDHGNVHTSALLWLPFLPAFLTYFTRPLFGILLAVFCTLIFSVLFYYNYFVTGAKPLYYAPQDHAIIFLCDMITLIIFSVFMASLYEFSRKMSLKQADKNRREAEDHRQRLLQSAKFHSLGEMAAGLAHEINNPLFVIQGKVHKIRNLLHQDKLDFNQCDEIVDDVEGILVHLSRVTKGISTFAREGEKDPKSEIDVSELIDNTVSFCGERFKSYAIPLSVETETDLIIQGHSTYLIQVFLNLLNNAVDAVKDKSEKKVFIKAYRRNNNVEIAIIDNGDGVPDDHKDEIFRPFFTTKPRGKGTGLGLSISKSLVEEHGGRITYRREADKTSFIVRLPL